MNYPKILTLGLHFQNVSKTIKVVNRTYEIISLKLKDDISFLRDEKNVLFFVIKDHPLHNDQVEKVLQLFPCLPLLVLPSSFDLEKSEGVFQNILIGMSSALAVQSLPKIPSIEMESLKGGRADIFIQFLGNFKASINQNQSLKLKGNLFTNLMAYLFYHHHQKIHQDKLIRLFWDGFDNDAAKRCLRVHIFNIKKQLKERLEIKDPIMNESGFYFFHPDISIQTDVDLFKENYKKGFHHFRQGEKEQAKFFFEKAIELYKGDFMEGNLREDWFVFERKKWKDRYLEILHFLAKNHFEETAYRDALDYCQMILEKDNCYESAHNLLIQVYEKLGQRGRAIRQFKRCELVLEEELGMKPSAATIELFERLKSA